LAGQASTDKRFAGQPAKNKRAGQPASDAKRACQAPRQTKQGKAKQGKAKQGRKSAQSDGSEKAPNKQGAENQKLSVSTDREPDGTLSRLLETGSFCSFAVRLAAGPRGSDTIQHYFSCLPSVGVQL